MTFIQSKTTKITNDKTPFFLGVRPQGRYGRLNYANAFCLILLIKIITRPLLRHTIEDIDQYLLADTIINAILVFFVARCIALRLHDMNFKAWPAYIWLLISLNNTFEAYTHTKPVEPTDYAQYLFLAIAVIIINIFLLSKKGNPYPNRYGQAPEKGPIWGLCGLIFFIVAIFVIPMLPRTK